MAVVLLTHSDSAFALMWGPLLVVGHSHSCGTSCWCQSDSVLWSLSVFVPLPSPLIPLLSLLQPLDSTPQSPAVLSALETELNEVRATLGQRDRTVQQQLDRLQELEEELDRRRADQQQFTRQLRGLAHGPRLSEHQGSADACLLGYGCRPLYLGWGKGLVAMLSLTEGWAPVLLSHNGLGWSAWVRAREAPCAGTSGPVHLSERRQPVHSGWPLARPARRGPRQR